MILRNLHTVSSPSTIDIRISNGKIAAIGRITDRGDDNEIIFDNDLVFPGLINSHDHLDFNIFPKLGNRSYKNYVEWGNDIHLHNKDIINGILKVPHALRVKWGMYKNLINGITTVVNHGPKINVPNDLITVFQQCINLHSVQLEKRWRRQLNNPFSGKHPVVIHIGEGIDETSSKEIDMLLRWNLLKKQLVGIHGIVMDENQAKGFEALVWCPDSNNFLVGKTADIKVLKNKTRILFGTDSAVSASWSIWEQLRIARNTGHVSNAELYEMITSSPAQVWKMNGKGTLKEGSLADIVITKQKYDETGYGSFITNEPDDILMVIRSGEIKLLDESLLKQLDVKNQFLKNKSQVEIGMAKKYIAGNLPDLMKEILHYNPTILFPIKPA